MVRTTPDRLNVFMNSLDVRGDNRNEVFEDWMKSYVLNVLQDDLPDVVLDRTFVRQG
jgi:hypothetical protein